MKEVKTSSQSILESDLRMVGLVIVAVVLLSYWLFTKTRKAKNFPPGPPRLPFLGSFPFLRGSGPKPSLVVGLTEQVMNENYIQTLSNYIQNWNIIQVKKHGPIVGFYFGDMPAVYLAEYHLIKEAFKMDSLSARPGIRKLNHTNGLRILKKQVQFGYKIFHDSMSDISPSEMVRPGYIHMNKSEHGGTPGKIHKIYNFTSPDYFIIASIRCYFLPWLLLEGTSQILTTQPARFRVREDQHGRPFRRGSCQA